MLRPSLGRLLVGVLLCLMIWFGWKTVLLQRAEKAPLGAFLVLGGSIQREIYVADLVTQQPEVPVLISQGSPDPCVWLIFQRVNAPIAQVWLEKCARSTFENFYYSLPILNHWRVRRVALVTSQTHLPRAYWMARILLGAQGIWVDLAIAPEQGIPGNKESPFKTGLDVLRSAGWALVSQVYAPSCSEIVSLANVDIQSWRQRGFHCEYQGKVGG